jgi:2-dehydro-3-deoxyphosphogluconate aldolase/(4S)-4-hydroxy-2-oxoglutarate aldolase
MGKFEIRDKLIKTKLVAILKKIDKQMVDQVVRALIYGGIKAIEVTVESKEVFDCIKKMALKYKDKLCVGAGAILDFESYRMAIVSGAQFIATPTLKLDIIRLANKQGKLCIPATMTPTEILTAYENGAEIVRVFPASSLEPLYFKEIVESFPHISLMATGGINLYNLTTFIKTGVKIFGVDSALIDREAIKAGDYKKIEENAKRFNQLLSTYT